MNQLQNLVLLCPRINTLTISEQHKGCGGKPVWRCGGIDIVIVWLSGMYKSAMKVRRSEYNIILNQLQTWLLNKQAGHLACKLVTQLSINTSD